MLIRWDHFNASTDLLAASQAGKTSLLFASKMQRILQHNKQFVTQSQKPDLHRVTVAYIAEAMPDFPVVIFDPSEMDHSASYNPFVVPPGIDLATHVSNLARSMIQNVSKEPPERLQTFLENAKAYFAFLAITKRTPFETIGMFDVANIKQWYYASLEVPEPFSSKLRRIVGSKSDFNIETGSLRRRATFLIDSPAVRRFTSSPHAIPIAEYLKAGISILWNCSPSNTVSFEASEILNGFLLSEILTFGVANSDVRRDIQLICDEPQEYAPLFAASILDTILGAGIRTCFSHHHPHQFLDERLRGSVETNMRIKVLGADLPPDVIEHYAMRFFRREINRDLVRQNLRTPITRHHEETFYDFGESDSTSIVHLGDEPREGSSSGTTRHARTVLVPSTEFVELNKEYYSLQEKVSFAAERLIVPDRVFLAALPDGTFEHIIMPELRPYLYNSERCLEFREAHRFHFPDVQPNLNPRSTRAAATRKKDPPADLSKKR